MPVAADFRLYHSNALEVLAGLLAEQVAAVPAGDDWLRPDTVLVPQFSMRRWLQQALAERLGVCANLRFLTPGEFVDEVLDAHLGPAPEGDRLAPPTLRWHLLRELRTAPPPALAGFLAEPDPLRAWSLAGALADTYERYQAWRRDWLLRWERGADGGDWQAALWRRVGRGRAHRARRIDDYLRRFGAADAPPPAAMPPRLFVFACQNVSPDVLQVIASQARAGEQHFYLHTPARAFWGDLSRWDAYRPADDDAFLGGGDGGPNPLLAAWGLAGRDFVAALLGGEAVAPRFELAPHAEPPRDTLLGRLQADVLDNRAPLAGEPGPGWPRAAVERGDASLQFHACHTPLREVQVLHDQLRALLEAPPPPGEPPLQPRDIAVLAPDIDRYAPHVEAVFGGALGTARELPYTIADTSPLASAPVAEAFLRLLELPLRAPTLADVLDLLAVPAIAARFGVDDADRGALQDWLQAAGARWGLDAADRAAHHAGGDGAYTFEFALDRLLLGYASGAEAEIGAVAPWPELEGQAADALDALLRFLALLREARARLAAAQPPAAWQQALEALLEDAFAAERDGADAAALRRLREAVAAFADGAREAGYDAPVEHAVVLAQLRDALGQADARAPFLSGGVCFGRMVPMRLIPFRVICLLGLDEQAFPARDPRDPLNRIARALDTRERRVGDPSRRDADRYLFLQLFASAGRAFYLSWCGMDPRDNARREPSALVSELLDAAARYHAGEREAVREALVVRHALQPFAPAAFGAPHEGERLPGGLEPRRFSYDERWHPAAREAPGAAAPPPFAAPALRLPPRGEGEPVLALERLRRALLRPHAVYLQDGLGLRLPDDEPPLPEHEPLGAPDALAQYQLREAVFAAWLRAGARPDPRRLHPRLVARALAAPGADGLATVAALLDEVEPFAAMTLEAGFGAEGARVPVAIDCGGGRALHASLDGVHGRRVLRVALRPKGLHGGHALRHGLDRLCAACAGLQLHELARPEAEAPPQWRTPPALAPARARAALAWLLALRERALREPLPFLPKAGYAFVRAWARKGDAEAALKAARDCWVGGERAGAPEATPATRLALRGRDPFLDDDAQSRRDFAALATALFAALEDGAAPDPEAGA
ncbi:DNA helicase/exodeoxyribonuclease V gamma subunit [Vulcaniibacterium tengchongense]|uniref:RecBCD enzyme subunit RecC n=2 Tax=Vulcaniibacterium tengchongense TaxID=1273429 RepID=A0A3N4VEE7_9GAMM|nr:exodeoxyribonuclease V subunit gamma [Vulcaniibacterium tengchongense]RPE80173.1 DNA helicase/exodeoxyribonuclease V gamma subunit [Vulcaniibacterium tengchongense]